MFWRILGHFSSNADLHGGPTPEASKSWSPQRSGLRVGAAGGCCLLEALQC